ncbi:MAG: polysaccharide biosynthesis/export family protein [Candidatus Sulfotelmatobacter sp.]
MEFGKRGFACSGSLFAFFFVLSFASSLKVAAQQASPSSNTNNNAPALAPAKPVSQAAVRSGPADTDSAKPAESATSSKAVVPADQTTPSMRLGPGDLIEVSVYNVPELSTKARISNTGDVYLPLIDYVHVGNLTVEEAQVVIEKRLEDGGYVRGAHVTIFLDESISQGITILGEVVRPGIYPSLGDRKLYDLISAAGGFTPSAGRKVSIIRQHSESGPVTVSLPRNLADDLQDDIELQPGDMITVPRAPIIYVVGDVGRPAGLLVDNGTLTVLQALALAGGTNHTAKMSGVRIIRKGPGGMTETRLPLKKMLEAKAPDITLQADDILFVPLSGARVAAEQTMQAAISAATGIAVIAAHP